MSESVNHVPQAANHTKCHSFVLELLGLLGVYFRSAGTHPMLSIVKLGGQGRQQQLPHLHVKQQSTL